MNFFKKIGSFFAAAVPFIVYITVQLVTVTLGVILVVAGEMMSSSELSGTISHKSNMAITVAVNLICLIAALWEMKIHRFGFKDISPVVQNKKVYIFAAFFAFGASLVFKFVSSLFMREGVTGLEGEITSGTEFLTFIAYLTAPFMDELFFRGMLVKTFEKRFPVWFGAAAVTVFSVFSVLLETDYYKCFGIMLVLTVIFIRYKFGDLRLCLLVHIILTAMFVTISLIKTASYGEFINIGIVVGAVIAATAMFFMLKYASKTERSSNSK